MTLSVLASSLISGSITVNDGIALLIETNGVLNMTTPAAKAAIIFSCSYYVLLKIYNK